MIAQDPSIIFSIIQKTLRIKFGELHKKSPTAKFNSMSNFLLTWYIHVVTYYTDNLYSVNTVQILII